MAEVGQRLMLLAFVLLMFAGGCWLYAKSEARDWDGMKTVRMLDVQTSRMLKEPIDPDAFLTGDQRFSTQRTVAYVAGGVGLLLLGIGWALNVPLSKPASGDGLAVAPAQLVEACPASPVELHVLPGQGEVSANGVEPTIGDRSGAG